MERFHMLTDVYFGDGALEHLSEIRSRKVFIVTDPFIVKSGTIQSVTEPLDKGGIGYEIFTEVVPDPPVSKVVAGIKAFTSSGCDSIIGIGGGSAMDLSKSIRKMAESVLGNGTHIRLICIPTTSGTGSEVTSFAVISDPAHQTKIPLVSDEMTPDEAVLDPILVRSVPASVTADTGMDVLTHAIESYVSTNHNDFSGALAEKAVEIVGQFLFRSYSDSSDTHARAKMHVAATLAGLAFNASSLGLNHGMAHALGAHFHIPHGRANAILLPHVIEYNTGINALTRDDDLVEKSKVVERYCHLANVLGLTSVNRVMTIRSLCSYIHYMNEAMGIPSNLRNMLKITQAEYEAEIGAMADAALADTCTATNPKKPLKPEVEAIYRKLW